MKILIADDHAIVREGLKQIVINMNMVSSVDEAEDGNQALEKIHSYKYDIIILDISMPGLSGLDILQSMKDRSEKANILILSMHPHENYALRALRLGASGYLTKDSAYKELETAIRKISSGGKYISSAIAESLISIQTDDIDKPKHHVLSDREFQIMCMISAGLSLSEIAAKLFISDKTVSTYRARILEKMNMKRNAELVYYSIMHNLIDDFDMKDTPEK